MWMCNLSVTLTYSPLGAFPGGNVAAWRGSSVFVFGGTFVLIFIVTIIGFIFLPALTDD